MDRRFEFQHLLEELSDSKSVYFQPPENLRMTYPAIVYSLDDIYNDHADNVVYKQDDRYAVTVIDPDPDGELRKKIAKLPKCRFNRYYTSDNLNHYVFTIFY